MKVICEWDVNDIRNQLWSGARDRIKYLTYEEIDTILTLLDECYPEGLTDTQVNDFFWFEEDTIAEWLGYNNFDEIMERSEEDV